MFKNITKDIKKTPEDLVKEEQLRIMISAILKTTFKESLREAMRDLEKKYDEIMCEVNKLGELEKRIVELEKIMIVNRLNLN